MQKKWVIRIIGVTVVICVMVRIDQETGVFTMLMDTLSSFVQ